MKLQRKSRTHWVLIGGLLGIAVWMAFPVHADPEASELWEVRSARVLLYAGLGGCFGGAVIEMALAAREGRLRVPARFTLTQFLLVVAIIAVSMSLWFTYRTIVAEGM